MTILISNYILNTTQMSWSSTPSKDYVSLMVVLL